MSLASRKLIQATAGAAGAVDTGDDDFANVVLLLDGDGTSGDDNETFTDSSTNGFTVTETGSVVQGSFSPYGDNWSVYFDGSSEIQTDSTINIGTSNFTIECWINWDGQDTDASFVATDGSTGSSWVIRLVSSNLVFRKVSSTDITTTHTMEVGVWTHVAVVREGTGTNQVKVYVNGVNVGEGTATDNYGTREINIGAGRGSTPNNVGYLSNVRLVVGSAVYTGDFTPSTTPLTDITNTKLLTCQSNRFVDNSSIGDTFNLTGTPKVTPFSPFKDDDARDITTDGGSAYFGGSDDYLISSTNFTAIGTDDFTIEFWYNGGSQPARYPCIIGTLDAFGATGAWRVMTHDNNINRFQFTYEITNYIFTTTNYNDNAWHHFAVTREGTTLRGFVDGVQQGSNLSFSSSLSSRKILMMSQLRDGGDQAGYVSDARVIKGTALYTSDFTPPTAPLTAVTNTELLLNFQDAGIYDRSGINNLDTVGNAQIDTAVKKYGTGSLEFDGTGDYLVLTDDSTLSMGTGDFTVEFWSYCTGTGYRIILDNNWNSTTNSWQIYINGEDTEILHANGASSSIGVGTAGNAVPNNQWTHLAFVKSGTTVKIYVNGTSTASGTMNVTFGRDSTNYIGIEAGSSYPFVGYIDDLRITKGVARYTSNFTPPSAELPKF